MKLTCDVLYSNLVNLEREHRIVTLLYIDGSTFKKCAQAIVVVVVALLVSTGFAKKSSVDPHAALFAKTSYPSAEQCASCHKKIYDEWRVSAHANADRSPIFYLFEQRLDTLTRGTKGSFCLRCHAGLRVQRKGDRSLPFWKIPKVEQEGVTCISCHRVADAYLRTNGARRIRPGKIDETPMNSSRVPSAAEMAASDHKVIKFQQMNKSEFCESCHQVAIHPGIQLEVVWDQYRHAPAADHGITCQQCHMGKVPGKPLGYSIYPDTGKTHYNHNFWGPSEPVTNPGLFPINEDANEFTPQAWFKFNDRAGWGTEKFEDKVEAGTIKPHFPKEWKDAEDRFSAREIIDENHEMLDARNKKRMQLFNGVLSINGPYFTREVQLGHSLRFYYNIKNLTAGHNLPSGSLGAQPQFWLNVVLTGPTGKRLWETGYLDSYGDLADIMSQDVLDDKLPLDSQLVNLQTKFMTTNVKGTDRENVLPVNFDFDQLAFIRPAIQPISVLNHPPFVRLEARSLVPLEKRRASYDIPASVIKTPGTYKLTIRMRYREWPIYFLKFIYAPADVIRRANSGIMNIHPYTVAFKVTR